MLERKKVLATPLSTNFSWFSRSEHLSLIGFVEWTHCFNNLTFLPKCAPFLNLCTLFGNTVNKLNLLHFDIYIDCDTL